MIKNKLRYTVSTQHRPKFHDDHDSSDDDAWWWSGAYTRARVGWL